MNATSFSDVLQRVLDDVYTALPTKPKRKCMVWGQEAVWDECDCGTLNGLISRWGVTQDDTSLTFPQLPDCALPYQVATMLVSIIRCVPVPKPPQQLAPTCQALETSALELQADAYWTLETTVCTLQELQDDDTISNWSVVQQAAIQPQGGCAGSAVQFNVWLAR